MKLYVHTQNNQIIPVEIEAEKPIAALRIKVSQILKVPSVTLSKFKDIKLQDQVHIENILEDLDDIYTFSESVQSNPEELKINIVEQQKKEPEINVIQTITLSKYTFYDTENWVKVQVPLTFAPSKQDVKVEFNTRRSFNLYVTHQGKIYHFGVQKTQCKYNNNKSTFKLQTGKIVINLAKISEKDNWFALFKVKTIGGDPDSD